MRTRERTLGRAIVVALPAWGLSRVVVVGTLLFARLTVSSVRPHNGAALARTHQGLLGWDAGWYQSIAAHGYAASGQESLRFFPVFPMLARGLAWIPGLGTGTAVVIVANLSALLGMAVLVVLVQRETGDAELARRTVWLLALAPPAYTLVLGYAEGTLLLCTTVAFLALRSRRWWWAAAAGLVAGAVRPIGLLLIVPALIEAWQARHDGRSLRQLVGRLAAVVAPVAGTAGFLLWVDTNFGDGFLPFKVQQQGGHRGPLADPFATVGHNVAALFHGHHLGSALHIPWVILSVVVLVFVFRRLPVSYGAFTAVVLAVSLTSSNLDSFERYALSAFPLVIAGSMWTSRRRVEQVVLVIAAVGMAAYAYLSFVNVVVP
ncbi:MAG TPA: hypothetical protein VNV87_07190 [Acidimicrobiales bacterium]|nr:hypothetical protein [Acidimicrobiales bacterium]